MHENNRKNVIFFTEFIHAVNMIHAVFYIDVDYNGILYT